MHLRPHWKRFKVTSDKCFPLPTLLENAFRAQRYLPLHEESAQMVHLEERSEFFETLQKQYKFSLKWPPISTEISNCSTAIINAVGMNHEYLVSANKFINLDCSDLTFKWHVIGVGYTGRNGNLQGELAVLTTRRKWVSTIGVLGDMKLFIWSYRKRWIAFLTKVSPILSWVSEINRCEKYEERHRKEDVEIMILEKGRKKEAVLCTKILVSGEREMLRGKLQ